MMARHHALDGARVAGVRASGEVKVIRFLRSEY